MRSFILLLSVLYACTATAQLPFKDIDKSIGRKDVVVYGEASYFLNSNHTAATELFKYLVVEKGFRVLVLESAWAIQSAVANYFSSNRITLYISLIPHQLLRLYRNNSLKKIGNK